MSRRSAVQNRFIKKGSFGTFSTPSNSPIEFVMTTFSHGDLSKLELARDITAGLDFQLLIQRDIDEQRALGDIGNYLNPKQNNRQERTIFLPPLLVAVVGVDDHKKMKEFYPIRTSKKSTDEFGDIVERSWGSLFTVTNYVHEGGKAQILTDDNASYPIDIDQCEIQVDVQKLGAGARLVVVDGQHRLFALIKQDPDLVKHLVVPVCIIFSPNSTEDCNTETIPSVLTVFRDLFVDVNSNVETVSGHFSILLSDNDLGRIISRNLCEQVLKDDDTGRCLQLIEWNTRLDKESKTISQPHTITSIGVIYDLLKGYFYNKKAKAPLLRYMIDFNSIEENLIFGEDDEGNPNGPPIGFPWTDFRYQNLPILKQAVDREIVPCIKDIFFEIEGYKIHQDAYHESLEWLEAQQNDVKNGVHYQDLKKVIFEFEKVPQRLKIYFKEFELKLKSLTQNKYPDIIRKNVFQKALLEGWLDFVGWLKPSNVGLKSSTTAYIELVNIATRQEQATFLLDAGHSYLNDSIFEDGAIKPTKESRNQIKRLMLGYLANKDVLNIVKAKIMSLEANCDEEKIDRKLYSEGYNATGNFAEELLDQRTKRFKKSYRSKTSLNPDVREEIEELENKFNRARADKSPEADELYIDFEARIKIEIKDDYESSISQLDAVLGFNIPRNKISESEEEEDS